MPPEKGVVITPRPAHRPFRTPNAMTDKRGTFLITFMTLTILLVAFISQWDKGLSGSVSVLVRNEDGTRFVESLNIATGTFTPMNDIDATTITTLSARTYTMDDGSVITIDTPGIVRKGKYTVSVLVASPVPPPMRTPLAVLQEGALVAWLSPADQSLQVFERTSRGSYIPTYLHEDLVANSIGFTEDGTVLVFARIEEDATTSFYGIELESGVITKLTSIHGLASVIPSL